jgi:hypothetical protein
MATKSSTFNTICKDSSTGLTVAKVTIEVEIAVENVKAAPFNEPLWFLLNGHCKLPHTHAKGNEGKIIKVFIIHVTLQAIAWQSFFMKYFIIIKTLRHVRVFSTCRQT